MPKWVSVELAVRTLFSTHDEASAPLGVVERSIEGLATNVVPVAAYVLSVMVDDAQGRETAHIDRALFLQDFAGRHGLVVEGHIGTDRASEGDFVVGSG